MTSIPGWSVCNFVELDKLLTKVISVGVVFWLGKISAQSYPSMVIFGFISAKSCSLTTVLRVISAGSCPLTTKIILSVDFYAEDWRWKLKRYLKIYNRSIESYRLDRWRCKKLDLKVAYLKSAWQNHSWTWKLTCMCPSSSSYPCPYTIIHVPICVFAHVWFCCSFLKGQLSGHRHGHGHGHGEGHGHGHRQKDMDTDIFSFTKTKSIESVTILK